FSASSIGYQAALPNDKINWNALNLPNRNIDYADGSWARRRAIVDEHNVWQQGLMWCMANDPVMASYGLDALQASAKEAGLCADEFTGSA
ncbi:hypothetical protein, partial [Shewanella algae]|uniref:hypothetical protein n=1 Tax=Shewanella algae TaxID=38313 RepID=UPI00313EEB57